LSHLLFDYGYSETPRFLTARTPLTTRVERVNLPRPVHLMTFLGEGHSLQPRPNPRSDYHDSPGRNPADSNGIAQTEATEAISPLKLPLQ
jgi:hypothetical protein